jgi:hypothetical protein
VYKRRIVLGGAAPAAVLAFGLFAAGPAMATSATSGLAQAPSLVSSPGSVLSSVPGLSGVANGGLQGVTSEVPAVSSLPAVGNPAGTPTGMSIPANGIPATAGGVLNHATGSAGTVVSRGFIPVSRLTNGLMRGQSSASGSGSGGALGNLGSVANSVPGVSQATGVLSGLDVAGDVPGLSTVQGLAGSGGGALNGLG